ncbi:MAG: sigma-70 family RNA polymerase sigma factor [Phycisphaerae bacterium]|nr:sigma-70 family RNA polymerase sigma factor [Phycisphaerae bacterium]
MDVFSEEQLVVRCRAGERDAYAELVTHYARQVFAVCLGVVGNAADAEDLAQEALVKGFEAVRRLRKGESFGPWIRRIARNLSVDFVRRQHVGREALDARIRDHESPRPDGEHVGLEQAMQRLEEKYRSAIVLYYFDGERTEAVAEKLEITPAAVLSRLSRARRLLREMLREQEDCHD